MNHRPFLVSAVVAAGAAGVGVSYLGDDTVSRSSVDAADDDRPFMPADAPATERLPDFVRDAVTDGDVDGLELASFRLGGEHEGRAFYAGDAANGDRCIAQVRGSSEFFDAAVVCAEPGEFAKHGVTLRVQSNVFGETEDIVGVLVPPGLQRAAQRALTGSIEGQHDMLIVDGPSLDRDVEVTTGNGTSIVIRGH